MQKYTRHFGFIGIGRSSVTRIVKPKIESNANKFCMISTWKQFDLRLMSLWQWWSVIIRWPHCLTL